MAAPLVEEDLLALLQQCSRADGMPEEALLALREPMDRGELRDLDFDSEEVVTAVRDLLLRWLGAVAPPSTTSMRHGRDGEGGGGGDDDYSTRHQDGGGDDDGDEEASLAYLADEYQRVLEVIVGLPEMTHRCAGRLLDHRGVVAGLCGALQFQLKQGAAPSLGESSSSSSSSSPSVISAPAGAATSAMMMSLGSGGGGGGGLDLALLGLLRRLVRLAYGTAPRQRPRIRARLGQLLSAAAAMDEDAIRGAAPVVKATLDVVADVIEGLRSPLAATHIDGLLRQRP